MLRPQPGTATGVRAPIDDEVADPARAEAAFRDFLVALGVDVSPEVLADSPGRVVRAYQEMFSAPAFELTTFPNDGGYDETVVVGAIPFRSVCEHHFLPFTGEATVAYQPQDRVVGLSKTARVVQLLAHRPQVQERLTSQVADHLWEALEPAGVGVVLRAEHTCMTLRGVRTPGSQTVTTALRGSFRRKRRRREFLEAAGVRATG